MILLFWYILDKIDAAWWAWGFFGLWAIVRVFWLSLKLLHLIHDSTESH